jgi:uncharacterized protein (TIGR02996 family)
VTTDATLAALLRDVLDAPDDDGARLRYADRLDELGEQERADFIRCGLELSLYKDRRCPNRVDRTLPGSLAGYPVVVKGEECGRCRYCLVRRAVRALTLLLGLNDEWPFCKSVEYRRGFAESIACTAADFLTHADAILAAHPVREVRLTELDYHPDAANFRLYHAECSVWLSHRWPGIKFHLPETTEYGAFILPEHLVPAIEALAQQGVNL